MSDFEEREVSRPDEVSAPRAERGSARRIPPRLPTGRNTGSAIVPRRPATRERSPHEERIPRRSYENGYKRVDPTKKSSLPAGLTVVALVALVAFFSGFAVRNIFTNRGGFDDERLAVAQDVPEVFRNFCVTYNGYPSFTLVELTSVSTLTVASVPVFRINSCTIPVSQTANALQALGVERRADTLGPQLGGSNLTLITIPLSSALSQAILNRFPALTNSANGAPRPSEEVQRQLQELIDQTISSNLDGAGLQSLKKTNIPDVYVKIPGHSFNLQPQLNQR